MKKHLPLILLGLFIAAIQIGSMWAFSRDRVQVASQLDRLRLDVSNGVIYATLRTADGSPVVIGMTPHAAIQMQVEMGHMITKIENAARAAATP